MHTDGSWAGLTSHTPSPWLEPGLRIAPSGTPLIVTIDSVSEPSVSVKAVSRCSCCQESSAPVSFCTVTVGASATALAERLAVPVVTPPFPSFTVKVKLSDPLQFPSGVKVNSPVSESISTVPLAGPSATEKVNVSLSSSEAVI